MSLTDNLKWQIDVNTRGRTDNEFYNHVAGALMTKNSAPALNTDQLFGAMDFDGTDDYFTQSFPAGLSATFLDSDFTIALRFLLDQPDTGNIKKPLLIGNSGSTARCDIGVTALDLVGGAFDTPSGTDHFVTSAIDVGDGKAHVAVWRRSGNVFSLWLDGVKLDEQTITVGTMGTMNQINVARRGGSSGTQWYFPGIIYWAAIWSDNISDGDLATLHTSINPFLTEEDGDYFFAAAGSTIHYGPTGAAAGDQIIMKTTAGAGALIPSMADVAPTTMPMTFSVWAWDVSALALLSRLDITVFLGQNRIVDEFTGTNGTALPSHTPDVDDSGAGWAYAAENNLESVPSSGITLQDGKARITVGGGGVVIDTEDTTMQVDAEIVVAASTDIHTIQFAWQDSSNRLSLKIFADTGLFQLNQRHLGTSYPNFGNGTFDLSALGTFAVTIVFEDGAVDVYCGTTQVITGAVPPREVASTATKAGIFSVNQAGSYPIEFGRFSANSEAAADRSLTASDSTLTPGQTATFTLVGANYGSAIDDVTIAGVAASIANADVNSFDLTAPAQSAFVEGGAHESTGWYRNIPVISETDAEVTVQIVAPTPANYGIVGLVEEAVYLPAGLVEGDEVYAVIDAGTGTFDPVTCSFVVTSGPLDATIYGFSVSLGKWVEPRIITDLLTERVITFDEASYSPGDIVTGTIVGGVMDNSTYTGVMNGAAITFDTRADDGFTFTVPGYEEFDDAGDHAATGFYRDIEVSIDDGAHTVSATLQIVPHHAGRFGIASGVTGEVPSGTVDGDEIYIHVASGTPTSITPETAEVEIQEKTTYYIMAFGIEFLRWRPRVLVEFKIAKGMKTTRQEVQRIFAMSGVKKQVINTYIMIDGQRVKLW